MAHSTLQNNTQTSIKRHFGPKFFLACVLDSPESATLAVGASYPSVLVRVGSTPQDCASRLQSGTGINPFPTLIIFKMIGVWYASLTLP